VKEVAVMGEPVQRAFVDTFASRWVDAVNAHDVPALLDQCCEHVEFKDPAYPDPFVGRAAVGEIVQAIFRAFPDLAFELQARPFLSMDGTVAAIHVHMSGTMSGRLDPPGFAVTDSPISVHAVEMYEFHDGRVCRIHLVFDMLDLGRQIGAAPPVGSRADRLGILLQRRTAKKLRRGRRNPLARSSKSRV
jgi:steroid delta-isomerase-like uncharacterized protein